MGTHEGRRRNRSIASQVRRATAQILGELNAIELELFMIPASILELPDSRSLRQWIDVLAKAEEANWIRKVGHEWRITPEGRLVHMAGLRSVA